MPAHSQKIRSFFAFEIPENAREWIVRHIITPLKEVPAAVKWVKRQNIHLTMRFLGEVEPKVLRKLVDTVRNEWEGIGVINLTLGETGYFGRNYPRVIWVGLNGEIEKLERVHDFLERTCRKTGLGSDDKKFAPHITIGRVKSPAQTGKLIAAMKKIEIEPVEIKFSEMVLFKSTLTPEGPIYEPLEHFAL